MQKNWQVRNLADTLIIVQLAHLYPQELSKLSYPLKEGDIDQWLADPLLRNTVVEIYETINGKAISNLHTAGPEQLKKNVRPRLLEAFRRRELVALRIPRSFLTQIVSDAEESNGAAPPKEDQTRKNLPTSWIEIKLRDAKGQPVPGEKYLIKLADGSVVENRLDEFGQAEFNDIRAGICHVSFPALEKESWWLESNLGTRSEVSVGTRTDASHRFIMGPSSLPDHIVAQVKTLRRASENGVPFCAKCEAAKVLTERPQPDLTVIAQAATLRAAAQSGIPFCAKCEEAREQSEKTAPSILERAQAATLIEASGSGIPFCAKCEEAKEEKKISPPSAFEQAQAATLTTASENGVPFCAKCAEAGSNN